MLRLRAMPRLSSLHALIGLLLTCTTACLASSDPRANTAGALPGSETTDSAFAAAIERTRDALFAEPYATSSPAAQRTTNEFLSALIESAWRLSHSARYLHAPRFSQGKGIVGLPGLFNPDNLYVSALLEPHGTYRVSGTRGSHALLTLQFLDSYPLIALTKDLFVINCDALGIRPGERFEFNLGGEKTPGHWWPLPASAKAVLVRQTFNAWSEETRSELRIDRLDATSNIPTGPIHADLAADYLARTAALWSDHYLVQLRKLPENVMPPMRASEERRGGLTGQHGVMARYNVAPDKALIVTVRASDATYQAIQLGNYWFATQNPVRHQSSLNRSQAQVDSDGQLRFVISHEDPGVANWLDPDGAESGYILLRWQGIKTELGSADQPLAIVIDAAAVRNHLPKATASVTAEQRQRQLAERTHLPALKQ